ncbi:MAG: NTP transferase domain-containing protein [Peptococcaceae bacterium]|nr:NTP transferase domain-containing protein [Peptococcaceae bacterium]
MKAIIMAGGKGSRLRPLTCNRPKPMVPILNRPVMSYAIDLLKKYGIRDIGVTLQYLSNVIKDHFGNGSEYGVHMYYFIEESPLGTAGSVKNAESFLNESFVVISGDALTDLDIGKAIRFHKEKGAIATLVLTRVNSPLEYGVVITETGGRIRRFLEKPSWSEVFSDTVNTGIYVLEPEVLKYFATGQFFDFSKDLFPLLLREGAPLFGVVLEGYWCDIGNISQYLQAQYDALAGKVHLSISAKQYAPGVWVGENVSMDRTCTISGPVLIGDNVQIGPRVHIEPFSIIGSGTIVQGGASIKRSVTWDHVYIGTGASLRGAVLGSRVQVQANAGIYEGAVVGDDSIIKERGILKPEVKLWPHKLVETGTTVSQSLVWGTRQRKHIFGGEGIAGLVNVELTPEFCARVAATFGSVIGRAHQVGISSAVDPATRMLKKAIISGLQSAGVEALNFESVTTTPMHRFAVRSYQCKGGVHVKLSAQDPDKAVLIFTDDQGNNIARGMERKIENLMAQEDFARAEMQQIKNASLIADTAERYVQTLLRNINANAIRQANYTLYLLYDHPNLEKIIPAVVRGLGLQTLDLDDLSPSERPRRWSEYRKLLPLIQQKIKETKAYGCAILDGNAEHLILVDDQGRVIKDDMLTALIALYILKAGSGRVVVPVTAPSAIEDLAAKYKAKVIRTKTSPQDFVAKILSEDVSQFFLHFDALAALINILAFTAAEDVHLSSLVDEIPSFHLAKREIPVSWNDKGRVIRKLIEDESGYELELLDGIKVIHPNGWALVLPDPEQPVCRIFSEGSSMEIAEELTAMYADKIDHIVGSSD